MDIEHLDVLMVGSMPPPVGGTSLSFQKLYDGLRDAGLNVSLLNTSQSNARRFRDVMKFTFAVFFSRRYKVVTLHLGIGAFVRYGWYFSLLSVLTGRRLILRRFGGICVSHLGFFKRIILLTLYKLSFAVLCQTRPQLKEAGKKGVWFPTGRDEASFKIKDSPPTTVRKLLFISQIKKEKGVFEVLEAYKSLRAFKDVELEVYGPIHLNVEDQKRFDLLAAGLYKGELHQEQVGAVIRSADLLLFPTYYPGEGYPGVLVESMMCGVGVVTTDWLSIKELVEDCALYCERRSVDALIQAVVSYCDDYMLRCDLYQKCAIRRKKFTLKRQMEVFVELLH